MIRVLQSVSNMDRAGIETMLMNYYRSVDKNQIQFDFLCNKSKIGAYDEEIKNLGGNIYYSPGFNPLKIRKYISFLKDIRTKNNIDIIHAHNAALSAYTLFCAKKAGFKIRIAHSHSTKIPSNKRICFFDPKWLYKKILKKFVTFESTYNIACGTEAGRFLFGNKKFDIINNSIFIQNFQFNKLHRSKIRKYYNISDDMILIGHIGRFNIVKNHKFIIDLFKRICENDKSKYKLILIGDGELKEKIVKYAESLAIADNLIVLNSCSNVNEFYSAMDIFVLPSKFEGIPVVGIEAQVSGLKCIFSKNVSREAKISNTVTFLSINKKESLKLWEQEILSFKRRNRINIETENFGEYDVENCANELVNIYKKLLNIVGESSEKNKKNN